MLVLTFVTTKRFRTVMEQIANLDIIKVSTLHDKSSGHFWRTTTNITIMPKDSPVFLLRGVDCLLPLYAYLYEIMPQVFLHQRPNLTTSDHW